VLNFALLSIAHAAKAAGWWDKDFVLQPAQMSDETVIQQAANQLLKQYGRQAAIEAAERPNAAIEAGNVFYHELWQRGDVFHYIAGAYVWQPHLVRFDHANCAEQLVV